MEEELASIPGWMVGEDEALFRFFLSKQLSGDLAELGVYMGRSAALIGQYLRDDETFTVVDLFEDPADDAANNGEQSTYYTDFTQERFEQHYLRFHSQLPVVVRGPSEEIVEHARHGTHRFVHVDASHLYKNVRDDIAASRTLLREDGVIALDDYRNHNHPGCAAAVWEAVINHELRPLILTPAKFYGTWGDPTAWRERLLGWLPQSGYEWKSEVVAGNLLLLCSTRTPTRRSIGLRALHDVTPPLVLKIARRITNRGGS